MCEPLEEESNASKWICSVHAKAFIFVVQVWFYSLESKGAAIKFPGTLKKSLLQRGAADQQELMRRVHEPKLLLGAR